VAICATEPRRQRNFFQRVTRAPRSWPGRAANHNAPVEDVLREMAFVYHVTRSLKAALLEQQPMAGLA